jgi:predicted ribosomally synthesized peptide with nif11-like leader
MSTNQVQAFLKLIEDDSFRAAFQSAATIEAKHKLLMQAGLDIAVEEAEAALRGERELTDQELDKVAGGAIGIIRPPLPPSPPPT